MWYHSYKSCINGKAPKGAEKDFDKLAGICEALVCVKRTQPGEESSVIRCKANPFELVCECKGSRKIGICAHILAVTHCWVKEGSLDWQRKLSFCNVRIMTQLLTHKKGGKWMKGKGATKLLHYLNKEVDSSDDEADASSLPQLTWWEMSLRDQRSSHAEVGEPNTLDIWRYNMIQKNLTWYDMIHNDTNRYRMISWNKVKVKIVCPIS